MECGYTCSAEQEHEPAMEQRQELAAKDRDTWLKSFDESSRYLDTKSGFWESLNGEIYSAKDNAWFPAEVDDTDSNS